jgi:hypothetical protein
MAGSPRCLLGRTVEQGGDTLAQPTARGGLLAQALSTWPSRGAGSEGSPVAYAGKGGRREYEGSARDVPDKEKCATAHRGGRASMRRQSRG